MSIVLRTLPIRLWVALITLFVARTMGQDASAFDLEQLMNLRVQSATLQKQTLRDAPADVTVVTAADIRRYGSRTLAEVLSNVRGFYITQDGGFQFAGVRGFSLLGDYNTRFLVMIDGHPMTSNVYSAMYMFGQDFGLDMDSVDQIEIVRGPSSALYGTNGMFATVNVLTKKGGAARTHSESTELGSFGESKLLASATVPFGGGGSAMFSLSGFYSGGREVGLQSSSGAASAGRMRHLGMERGFHTFTNVTWRNWSFAALWGDRSASVPLGYFGADVGDTGTVTSDSRNYAEIGWSSNLGENKALRWRAYYDQWRYDAIYNYLQSNGVQNFDGGAGDWVGNQLVYQHRTVRLGSLTLGTEANVDLRNMQYSYDVQVNQHVGQPKEPFRIRRSNVSYAVFAQHELNLGRRYTLYLGGRFDDTKNDKRFMSPRVALIYKQSATSYKFMYGRAFRNPSTFERYWEPNPTLRAERMTTLEFSREQSIQKRLTLVTSVFHYRLADLIGGVEVSEYVLQYRNKAKASATGVELELSGKPTTWLHAGGSLTIQQTRGSQEHEKFENSPARVAQFRMSAPLGRDRLIPALTIRHLSSRLTAIKSTVPAVTLADATVTSRRIGGDFDLQFGVRNLLDKSYADPLSGEHVLPLLPRAGRTFFVKLTWQRE